VVSEPPKPEHLDRKTDLAESLLVKVQDGLSAHSRELATFSQNIDPATSSACSSDPLAQMQRANESLDALVEEIVHRLASCCGPQFSAEQLQLKAYQQKTNDFDQRLGALPSDLLMNQVVAELLTMVRELRDENESVRKEIASVQKELRELSTRAISAERDARIDFLTQLMNRRAFDEIHAAYEQRAYCLLLLDADNFKLINDEHGHPAGDAVLALIGKIIRENCRMVDQYARWGGEEFAILMPDADERVAWGIAERLRRKIESTVLRIGAFEHNKIKFTVSCGISRSSPGKSRVQILEEVDQALFVAKDQGRNRTVIFGSISSPRRDVMQVSS
jgi:diguanylate cyclase